jgi:uridine kinase
MKGNRIQRIVAAFTAGSLLAASVPSQVWAVGGRAVVHSAPTNVSVNIAAPTSYAPAGAGATLATLSPGSLSLNSNASLYVPGSLALPSQMPAQTPAAAARAADAAAPAARSSVKGGAVAYRTPAPSTSLLRAAPKSASRAAVLKESAPAETTPAGRDFQSTRKRVTVALETPGLDSSASAEVSRGAADKIFAALRGAKTSGTGGAVAASGRTLFGRAKGLALNPAVQPLDVKPESVPEKVPGRTPKAKAAPKHNWKTIATVGAGLALLAASPFLTAYAGASAAIGSLTLGAIGLPQIWRNYKLKQEGVKDLAIASTLIWFGGASLISAVSIGQVVLAGGALLDVASSAFWWNLVNVLGVAQSATILGQINYYRRTKADLVKTALTVLSTAIPLSLMAAGALLPLTSWINLAFTGAMSLFLILNFPQIKQNFHTWKTEGRIPEGVAPLYPLLVALGSAFHLYAAIVGGDVRWVFNALLAILGSSAVLSQIYAPKTTNRVLGPAVVGVEKLVGAIEKRFKASKKARLLRRARSALAPAFEGEDVMRHVSPDAKGQISEMLDRAGSLPGRSAIILQAPTAAGKSTLATELGHKLGKRIKSLEVDRYFKAIQDVPVDEDGHPDFDRPDSLHLEWVAEDIKALLRGEKVELPYHDMASGETGRHSGEFFQLGPKDVLVIDSIFASHDLILEAIGETESLNIHLFAPTAARLARRLARDTKLRGTSVAENLGRWPMILQNEARYIRPMRQRADLDINLMTEKELGRLQEFYAEILAEAWAKHGEDPALAEQLVAMIKASLAAER